MTQQRDLPEGDFDAESFLGWLEFGCWTVLALAPLLRFVNGPAVSRDQFAVQIGLIILAATTAIGLLVRRLKRR